MFQDGGRSTGKVDGVSGEGLRRRGLIGEGRGAGVGTGEEGWLALGLEMA